MSKSLLSRLVLGLVFCPTNRLRIFARFREQSAFTAPTSLSLGLSLQVDLNRPQHNGQCKPFSPVVSLCQFCASFDRRGVPTLWQRPNERRAQIVTVSNRLCVGRDHHRSVPDPLSWPLFSTTKTAIKLHTLMVMRGAIPSLFKSSTARCTSQSPRHPR